MNLPVVVPRWIHMLYPQRIWKMATEEKKLYLTFDDGPHATITPQVLDLLHSFHAKATFFCVGDNVRKNPDVFQRILQEGHAVGNHTYHHLNGWNTAGDRYKVDVKKADDLIQSSLFRPPYGRVKNSQANWLYANGFQLVMWTLLTSDYDKSLSKERCAKRVINNLSPGAIVLFHDAEKAEKNMFFALEKVLQYATNEGYRFDALTYKKGSA
jgi:hypothetical protein